MNPDKRSVTANGAGHTVPISPEALGPVAPFDGHQSPEVPGVSAPSASPQPASLASKDAVIGVVEESS